VLLQAVDHPAELFAMPADELEAVEGIGPLRAKDIIGFDDWDKVDRLLELTHRSGAQVVSLQDENYLSLLREIYDPPILLWVKGDPNVLNTPGIAVVGTRRATKYGLSQATAFSKKLAQKGLTIFSGLAYGVDAASHQATLKAGGKTVAV